MSLTRNQLLRLFPKASHDFYTSNLGSEVQDAKSQCNETPALGGAVQGEKQGVGRIRGRIKVEFVLHRVHPLDPDAASGSTKDLLDGLRHAGLLPGDNPWQVRLEVEQEKVAHYIEEKTVITIIP